MRKTIGKILKNFQIPDDPYKILEKSFEIGTWASFAIVPFVAISFLFEGKPVPPQLMVIFVGQLAVFFITHRCPRLAFFFFMLVAPPAVRHDFEYCEKVRLGMLGRQK